MTDKPEFEFISIANLGPFDPEEARAHELAYRRGVVHGLATIGDELRRLGMNKAADIADMACDIAHEYRCNVDKQRLALCDDLASDLRARMKSP